MFPRKSLFLRGLQEATLWSDLDRRRETIRCVQSGLDLELRQARKQRPYGYIISAELFLWLFEVVSRYLALPCPSVGLQAPCPRSRRALPFTRLFNPCVLCAQDRWGSYLRGLKIALQPSRPLSSVVGCTCAMSWPRAILHPMGQASREILSKQYMLRLHFPLSFIYSRCMFALLDFFGLRRPRPAPSACSGQWR